MKEILIAVYKYIKNTEDSEYLDYIKLNKISDMVEFVNFSSMITFYLLELSYIIKVTNTYLVGRYRDSLKIAALILYCYSYYIKIINNNRYYNFSFKGRFKNKFNY